MLSFIALSQLRQSTSRVSGHSFLDCCQLFCRLNGTQWHTLPSILWLSRLGVAMATPKILRAPGLCKWLTELLSQGSDGWLATEVSFDQLFSPRGSSSAPWLSPQHRPSAPPYKSDFLQLASWGFITSSWMTCVR